MGILRKVHFLSEGGGGGEASEGRVISNIFTDWGGPNLFCSLPGEGHTFFGKEKITPCCFYLSQLFYYFVNKHAKSLEN